MHGKHSRKLVVTETEILQNSRLALEFVLVKIMTVASSWNMCASVVSNMYVIPVGIVQNNLGTQLNYISILKFK